MPAPEQNRSGNISNDAMAQASGTVQARRCASHPDRRAPRIWELRVRLVVCATPRGATDRPRRSAMSANSLVGLLQRLIMPRGRRRDPLGTPDRQPRVSPAHLPHAELPGPFPSGSDRWHLPVSSKFFGARRTRVLVVLRHDPASFQTGDWIALRTAETRIWTAPKRDDHASSAGSRDGQAAKPCEGIDPLFPPTGAFQCHFKGLTPLSAGTGSRGISPCISCACAVIRVGGDVAERSKALPC